MVIQMLNFDDLMESYGSKLRVRFLGHPVHALRPTCPGAALDSDVNR